jgi:hypothetical protein
LVIVWRQLLVRQRYIFDTFIGWLAEVATLVKVQSDRF